MTSAADHQPWHQARLVALDLEGSGAQDGDEEAILEIAAVPLTHGQPNLADAYTTLLNPGRTVPRRPWISPGLTTRTLATAPTLEQAVPQLIRILHGAVMVGHNIGVDYRLLRRRLPSLQPAALIDTLTLARQLHPSRRGLSLTALLEHYQLTPTVTDLAPGSQPHRALWDTLGTALLLSTLITHLPATGTVTYSQLHTIAGRPLDNQHTATTPNSQDTLF